MKKWFYDLPPVGRSLVFALAMLTLNIAVLLTGAVMSAFGHPDLLAAATRASELTAPALGLVAALLPVGEAVDRKLARSE